MKRFALACLLFSLPALAHVGEHPSIHDTINGVVEKLRGAHQADALRTLTVDQVLAVLSEEDLHVLGTEFWSFEVDMPVTVHVAFDAAQDELPGWIKEAGFAESKHEITVGQRNFKVFSKKFSAGRVELGYPGFDAPRYPYFVLLSPPKKGDLAITKMYPGRHSVIKLEKGARVYVDEEDAVSALPKALEGAMLVQGIQDRVKETQLLRVFRTTDYPATAAPDQITLTWSDDPRTTQTVQWRTAPGITSGSVKFHPESDPAAESVLPAEMTQLEDVFLVNDPVNHRFTAVMRGLRPATRYVYHVRAGDGGAWAGPFSFRTAPDKVEPFKFVYMGDAQNGLDTWGKLLAKAHASEPEARFYIMAGDLVNRGIQRDDWDSFFKNATGVYDHRQLVPCIGNHEDQGDHGPWMYLQLFDLPKGGPQGIDPERAYSFTYSNALFVILDSNLAPATQTAWLEQQLAGSDAKWKFVVYHHPAFPSSPKRTSPPLLNEWTPLFDKYHVDLALQGHDHAYLRTYPMKGKQRVASPAEGTIYLVSVSGTKFYDQGDHPYTEFGMTNVATYQVLDITIEENRLVYKAYDIDGQIRDQFIIEK